MKKQYIIISLLSVLLVWNACKKEEQAIPKASSVAAFTVSASSQFAPAIITIENNSINAKAYHWDFGNGVTSTEQNPAPIKMDEPGLYNITLEIEPMDDLYYNQTIKSIPVNLIDPNADKVKTFYYTSRTTGKVHYVRLDGEEPVIYDFPTGGLYKPYGMAIDYAGAKIYVSDTDGFIYRYDLNGENQEVILSEDAVPMLSAPYGLVIANGKIYWAKEGGIGRANLDGSSPEEFAVFGGAPELPLGMAYDSIQEKIYFVNDRYDFSGGVWTINLDGSGLTEVISGVDAGAIALDTENGKMYYADWTGGVFMANLDGSEVTNINGYFNNKFCWGIAVDPDGGHVYVPDRYEDGIIVRSGLDGSNPENWITGVNAYAMAIDIYR